ncbi:hypothetical protein WJX72_009540 [[Myrmecia] bisecta]|uniref:Uncharacterized protein n=1 Tax=[Myrmecia] bisecta TaxID=41462 RepID=A0AAW1R8U7_9CHLO
MSTSAVIDPANLPATVAQLRAKIEGGAGLRLVYEDARRDMNIPPARKGASSDQELLAEVQARVEGLNVPQWEGRSWQAGMRGGDRVDILDPRSGDKLGSATVLYGLTRLNSVRDPVRTVLRVEERVPAVGAGRCEGRLPGGGAAGGSPEEEEVEEEDEEEEEVAKQMFT